MKRTNPILRNDIYEQTYALTERPMTISGTINKLLLLSLAMLASAAGVYYQFSLGRYDFVQSSLIGGIIIGFIVAIVLAFKRDLAKYLAPVYALAQGAAISAISCIFEAQLPGIVMQAVSITLLVVLAMALLFKTKIIRATETLKSTIAIGTLAIGLFYFVSFILMLFGVNIPYFTATSPINIAVNAIIAGFAAFNLIIDFDFIEQGEKRMLPSTFEWYGAFGLLVTILWLYIEILRLLVRIALSRKN